MNIAGSNPAPDSTSKTAADELAAAQTHIQAGRLVRARRHLRKALEAEPNNLTALLMLAGAAADRGRASQTLEWLDRALAAAPDSVEVHTARAQFLLQQNQFEPAANHFERALNLGGEDVELRSELALSLQQLGRYEEAEQHYRQAIELAPDDARACYNLGTLLKRRHDFHGAMDMYRRAVTLAPYDDNYRLRLAVALIEGGEFRESTEHLDVLAVQNPADEECAYFQSYAHMKLGEGSQATAAANRYRDTAGDSVSTLTSVASTNLCAGEIQIALDACEEALRLGPGHRHALADYAIALASLDQGRRAKWVFDTDSLIARQDLSPPPGFESIAAFNQELVAHIRSHPNLDFDRISLSCHEGNTSTELLVEPLGPLAHLRDFIRAAARAYRDKLPRDPEHPYLANLPADVDELELSAWATVLRNQGYQHGHIHATAWISGVYYVSLPDVIGSEDGNQQGFIEFGRAPHYYPAAHQGHILPLAPREGLLLLFPSYFFHRTLPFQAADDRITVAFDLRTPGAGSVKFE